jgi:hypothetical protein
MNGEYYFSDKEVESINHSSPLGLFSDLNVSLSSFLPFSSHHLSGKISNFRSANSPVIDSYVLSFYFKIVFFNYYEWNNSPNLYSSSSDQYEQDEDDFYNKERNCYFYNENVNVY